MFNYNFKRYLRTKQIDKFKTIILGCQRSGTTLLKEILDNSQLYMFEENWILPYFYRERWHACGVWHRADDIDTKEQAIWDGAVREFIEKSYGVYFSKNRKPCHDFWGAKAPGLNMAKSTEFMESLFPELKFVIIIRDPRDTFSSMQKSAGMISNIPEDFYKDAVNSPDLVELSMLPHSYWGAVYSQLDKLVESSPLKCHIIRYEELLEDPVRIIQELCSFIDVSFSVNMLEPFCKKISNASIVSMSYEDYLSGNYTISKSAVGRWKKDLSNHDCEEIIKYNRKIAKKWGYEI